MWTDRFHQANLISSNLDTVCVEVLTEVQNVQNNVLEAVTNQPHADTPEVQTANAVVQDPQMASLVSLISNLTTIPSYTQSVHIQLLFVYVNSVHTQMNASLE